MFSIPYDNTQPVSAAGSIFLPFSFLCEPPAWLYMSFMNLWLRPKLLYDFCMLFTKLWPFLNLLYFCAAFLIGIFTMCPCDLCVSNSHRISLLIARDLLIVESAFIVLWEISHPTADDRWHVIFHVFRGILLKRSDIIVASISLSALVDGRTPESTSVCL